MKKLVLVTVAKTLAVILVLSALIYGVFALFFPKNLADGFYSLGNYKAGMHYYERQYNKTLNDQDLIRICDLSDEINDASFSEKYLKIFTEKENFKSLCSEIDGNKTPEIKATEYYYGKYAVAVFCTGDTEGAVSVCEKYVNAFGYTENTPYVIIYFSCKNIGEQEKTKLKDSLSGVIATLTGNEKTLAQSDYDLING